MNNNTIDQRSKKRKPIGWIIFFILFIFLTGSGFIGWGSISKEHTEAINLPLDGVDFKNLQDGTYVGEYEGGVYKWRSNKVEVTVSNGKVENIRLLYHKENQTREFTKALYDKVITSQSLDIDTVSGATLTSKAYLKSVEIALIKSVNPNFSGEKK